MIFFSLQVIQDMVVADKEVAMEEDILAMAMAMVMAMVRFVPLNRPNHRL